MASVELFGIGKTFGNVEAVRDVTLEIGDGEFVVLLGPSGCGKSTLLRMIAGLEEISTGELRIGDKRMNDVPAADRGVAMVFQSYALYPHMNVAENMGFGLRMAGITARKLMRRSVAPLRRFRSATFSTASRKPSQEASGSVSPSAGQSHETPTCSCSTNRFRIWMLGYESRCDWRSRDSIASFPQP
jgi:ABC-type sugar transport system ATPase subunit